jgi:hypothetical protein
VNLHGNSQYDNISKGPSHQIIFVRSKIIGGDMDARLELFLKLPSFSVDLQSFKRTIINDFQSSYLWKIASVHTSRLLISTFCYPILSNQSEIVLHFILISYWLNVLLFPVCNGGEQAPSVTG